MSNYQKFSDAEKKQILILKEKGISNRQIAREFLGNENRESSIRGFLKENPVGFKPKVLLFDIETAPSVSYHWGRYNISVGVSQSISRPYLITWAAQWLGSDEIISDMLPNHELYKKDPTDDTECLKTIWDLLDEADVVIGHYGKRFDVPMLFERFLVRGLPKPSPFKQICTKEIASKHFKFETNQLDEIAQALGVGKKISTDFSLWRGCVEGDMESWNKMLAYNEMDVEVLKEVYLKLRSWDTTHPIFTHYAGYDTMTCITCGSLDVEEVEGKYHYTPASKFQLYQCGCCGKYQAGRVNLTTKEERQKILKNVK